MYWALKFLWRNNGALFLKVNYTFQYAGVESIYEWKGEVNSLFLSGFYSTLVCVLILEILYDEFQIHVLHLYNQIQTDSEELLIIKTRESLLEALTEHVKANHEYE